MTRTEAMQAWRDKYLPVAHSLAATVAVLQFQLEACNPEGMDRTLLAAEEKLARLSFAQFGPELSGEDAA